MRKLQITKASHTLHERNNKRGFALLIAIVVATVILTVGISIVNTALREVVLASTVRNSLASFYMADSGAECALYWDNVRGNHTINSVFDPNIDSPAPSEIECSGIKVQGIERGRDVSFNLIKPNSLNEPCARVNVRSVQAGPKQEKVVIGSLGANTCDPGNSKKVERALEVRYDRFE